MIFWILKGYVMCINLQNIFEGLVSSGIGWTLNKYKIKKSLIAGAIRDLKQWNMPGFGNASCPFPLNGIKALCDAGILSAELQSCLENAIATATICARNNKGDSRIGGLKNRSTQLIEILEKLR